MRIALVAAAVALATLNTVVTVRLWRSAFYERGQKVAQTALLWLVPGAFTVVQSLMRSAAAAATPDPTASNDGARDFSVYGTQRHHGSFPDGT
jgi:hypothetical protein